MEIITQGRNGATDSPCRDQHHRFRRSDPAESGITDQGTGSPRARAHGDHHPGAQRRNRQPVSRPASPVPALRSCRDRHHRPGARAHGLEGAHGLMEIITQGRNRQPVSGPGARAHHGATDSPCRDQHHRFRRSDPAESGITDQGTGSPRRTGSWRSSPRAPTAGVGTRRTGSWCRDRHHSKEF